MTLRWGIAGTGAMARVFAADLPHARDAVVAAVSSRSRDSAEAFAGDFEHARGLTHRELIDDPDVDVVYVATPHPQHLALAMAAIEAGKPVLVEKAFTATLAGAEQVAAASRDRGVFCMEAMWTRFLPALVRVRELVASGEIGDPLLVQADLGAFRAYDPGSRLFDPLLGGGAILDLGVYVVSVAQHFLGDPDRVTATGTTYPNGADRSVALHLAYDDGRAASL
jgi:predicted dehydrogenase